MKASTLLITALFIFTANITFAQTTEITYQGHLQSSSAPANGNFDFEFLLFDALTGGTQIGSTLTRNGVAVANGIFAVNLDFGGNFPGANRFLEIHVRQSGGGAFTPLTPRQAVSSTPYAIKSLNADTATTAVNATNATTATNANQLGGVAASGYLQTNGNGSALTNLNAASITTGTLSNARLGLIPTANIADSAVTSPKIATGQVVKSLNGLTDNVTLAGSGNITITPAGNTLTIASTGGSGGGIQNQTTLQTGANFNIDGTGTANILNAQTQYNIGGNRVLSSPGLNNLFAGVGAGLSNTTGGGNSFVGTQTGQNNTTGNNNSFVGTQTGQNNTTGFNNSFVGANAGLANTDGFDNAFFGTNAGLGNASGGANSFFGVSAGFNNTASDNSFFGRSAGFQNTNGSGNSFFGRGAGRDNSTKSFNSFFGYQAGLSSTGANNSFFGYLTGVVTTGDHNAFFGAAAGFSNTTGNSNAFFGDQAGFGNMGGGNNAFFGNYAGYGNTGGGNNAFFGFNAGISNTLGTNNTVIGNSANVGSGSLDHATAIGAGATVSSSNTLVLGREGIDNVIASNRMKVASIPLLASAAAVCFNAAGDLLQCGASSLKWKTNVQSYHSGLDVIQRLRPISFDWKEDGRSDIGLGAEDVAKTAPFFAFRNKEGVVEGVKYERLNILLINAVQEQQKQIEKLVKQVGQQRQQIRGLTRTVRAINSGAGGRRRR